MPLPLLCLLTAVPALQTPVPVGDAQAVLAAARAKAKSVMEARAAHIQAGKNTKDFRGDCSKELAELEVGRNILGMRLDQCFEMQAGILRIARVGAIHRQTVAGKRVVRLRGDELFEQFAACFFLWLGHG